MKYDLAELVAILLFAYGVVFRLPVKSEAVGWFAFLFGWVALEFVVSSERGAVALSSALVIGACYLFRVRSRQRRTSQTSRPA